MKQKIRINENQLKQIVTESVKRVLNEGIGDEYLDNFGKSVSRSKRFGNVKDLSSWSDEQFDSLNSTRKDMHKKGRGVKTKGSTETRDWLRKQTEKGNPIIKYKKNPDEWMKKHLDSVDESKIKKAIKESLKKMVNELTGWGSDPEDFVIIGDKLYPNKTYCLIKISQSGGLYAMFVTEYKDYFPDMLNDIKEFTNDQDIFHPMQDYIDDVHEIMQNDGVDEETAEMYADDVWLPVWDYDFAVFAPYGLVNSEPMSGIEMQQRINDTAKDSWLKH